MKKFKQQLVAWLRARGFKPHYSNVTHLKVGYEIGFASGALALGLFGFLVPIAIAFIIAVVTAIASASVAGYVKEKNDGENFDWLDLISTALGGILAGLTLVIIFIIVNLIFI